MFQIRFVMLKFARVEKVRAIILWSWQLVQQSSGWDNNPLLRQCNNPMFETVSATILLLCQYVQQSSCCVSTCNNYQSSGWDSSSTILWLWQLVQQSSGCDSSCNNPQVVTFRAAILWLWQFVQQYSGSDSLRYNQSSWWNSSCNNNY